MLDERQVSNLVSPELKRKLASLCNYLTKRLGISNLPILKAVDSKSNAENSFGYTGYYDPENNRIIIYVTDRHDSDILRSFSHEMVHCWQNERGTLLPKNQENSTGNGYAQSNPWLRRREMEAYLFGNILFRDWQDEQRYGYPKSQPSLPPPLDENFALADGDGLKNMVENFVNNMIRTGILSSYDRNLSSGRMNPEDFVEDLTHKILSAIQEWIKTINDRGNWENDEGGMIK